MTQLAAIKVFVDCSVHERSGTTAAAWIITRQGQTIKTGETTILGSNSALGELHAILFALQDLVAKKNVNAPTVVYTDAQGSIGCILRAERQLARFGDEWMPSRPMYVAAREVCIYARRFRHLTYQWVPREENRRVDFHVKIAAKTVGRRVLRSDVISKACANLDHIAAEASRK